MAGACPTYYSRPPNSRRLTAREILSMQTKTIILAAAAILGAGLIAGSVAAQGMAGGKMFKKLDTDGSGTVSRAEVHAGQGRMFARLDIDADGTISREEFQAMADRRFAKIDLDGNGEITREEVDKMKKKHKNNASD